MLKRLTLRTSILITTLLAFVTFAASNAAQAQEITLAPSKALSCLVRKDGKDEKLEYPKDALLRKDSGVVKVQMTFTAPDRAPRVKIDGHVESSELEDAVSNYVSGFRLTCVDPNGAPVTLQQDYVFVPNDGRKVASTNLHDEEDDALRKAQLGCIRNTAGQDAPIYPTSARQDGSQGRYYVDMSFAAPDRAPELQWLVAARSRALRDSVESYLKDMRMPCQSGEPAHMRILFVFKLVDGDRLVFHDMSLRDFIVAAHDVPTPVYFDTTTMGCPFDLRIGYKQPFDHNYVAELDKANPARKPLIDWLSNIKLRMNPEQLAMGFGSNFTVSVPCGTVDL